MKLEVTLRDKINKGPDLPLKVVNAILHFRADIITDRYWYDPSIAEILRVHEAPDFFVITASVRSGEIIELQINKGDCEIFQRI